MPDTGGGAARLRSSWSRPSPICSLIIGELVPKHLALRNAEGIACAVAPSMTILSRVGGARGLAARRLDAARLPPASARTTEQRERGHRRGDQDAGRRGRDAPAPSKSDERRMIAGVMRLGDRAVRAVMTPRTEVDWIDLDGDEADGPEVADRRRRIRACRSAKAIVDNMIGVVQARELLAAMLAGQALDLRAHVRTAPDRARHARRARRADDAARSRGADGAGPRRIRPFRRHRHAGRHPRGDHRRVPLRRRRARSRTPSSARTARGCLPATMPADEMAEQLGIDLPENRDYETVAGSSSAICTTCRRPARRRRAGLALRGRRPRRPPHRQGPGEPARRQRGERSDP